MSKRSLTAFLLVFILIASLLAWTTAPVLAGDPPEGKGKGLVYKGKVTAEEKKAASKRFQETFEAAVAAGAYQLQPAQAGVPANHILGADGLPVPHYFGPYPNYALSELPVVDEAGNVTPGTGIRKFIDSLPGLGEANANNLGQYMPVAVPDTTTYPGADYYEIGMVEYMEQQHTDIPPTKMRAYVQLSTPVVPGKNIPLNNLDGSPVLKGDGSQAYAVDNPHYLGPIIVAQRDYPVRVTFYNLLPTGDGGNLFIPVDTTIMGAGMGPVMDTSDNPIYYTQNRAVPHLHGGHTPWISDGTPHQWITPAGEDTPYPAGVSVYNVPDMPDPGPGAMTFFYTNQQSARLMFYHDHAIGITRLNVYAGLAAGYLIEDEVEKELVDGLIIPADQIPLIIQDKTFIPRDTGPFTALGATYNSQMAFYDPTWEFFTRFGGPGGLWYPHVYMPVQNAYDISGINSFGRWHYGPWFWPPTNNIKYPPVENPYYDPDNAPWEPPFIPGTPSLSMGMETFFDTPLVNGTAYPYLEVDPKAYRFRILNAANDRFWNLQLYVADPDVVTSDGRSNTEVRMVPAEKSSNLPEGWPTDGRDGGVPDPAQMGPSMIQIGTEGGFLPKPVVLPNKPVTWNLDPTNFDFAIVNGGTLILAPAERADVIIDFSAYAGQTLILYNDSPAPFPAPAAEYDYYTGVEDNTPTGGSPGTEPGYGPNTRTIMQIRVAATTPAAEFDLAALNNAFVPGDGTGVFVRGQEEIIVGQAAYNDVYNTVFPTTWPYWGYSRIQDNNISFQTVSGERIDNFYMEPKAIQDEMGEAFDKEYGRMSGFLGLELPFTRAGAAQFVLYPFLAPPVELIPIGAGNDGTQIWKITHNGVDTHPVHFHLFEVQLLNRVAWDGGIRLPDPNELGWKDTVRINPLQDTIVALRPVKPELPFQVPNSIRLIDPTKVEGEILFVEDEIFDPAGEPLIHPNLITDPVTGLPVSVINHYVNFGWEYVYHCHILSHEEMDMMHTVSYVIPPEDPSELTAELIQEGQLRAALTWTDNSMNETEWVIQRASSESGPWTVLEVVFSTTATTIDTPVSYEDTTIEADTAYYYRVQALNVAGDRTVYLGDPEVVGFPTVSVGSGFTNTAPLGSPSVPAAPTGLTAALQAGPQVLLEWTDNAVNETGFVIERYEGTGEFSVLANVSPRGGTGSTSYIDTTVVQGNTYTYQVAAVNPAGQSAYSNTAPVSVPTPPAAPTGLTAALQAGPQVLLGWTDNAANETGYIVERAVGAGAFSLLATLGANSTSYTDAAVTPGNTYTYQVAAFNLSGQSAYSNEASVNISAAPPAPSNVVATAVKAGNNDRVTLTWTDVPNEAGYTIQRATNSGFTANLVTSTAAANATTFTTGNLTSGTAYYFRIRAYNSAGTSEWANATPFPITAGVTAAPAAPSNVTAATSLVGSRNARVTLTWTDNAVNETGFTIQRSTGPNFTAGDTIVTSTVKANTTKFTTGNLPRGTVYYFRIQSYNNAGASGWVNSEPFMITTP